MPVIGILDSVGATAVAAFRGGMNETGYSGQVGGVAMKRYMMAL
jgi:hypothetical protein